MRFSTITSAFAFFLLSGLCCLLLLSGDASATSPSSQATPRHPLSAVGLPAIPPRLQSDGKTRPSFTEQDVKDYIARNGFIGGTTAPGTAITIKTLQFMTAQEASKRLGGEDISRNMDSLVCMVEIQGSFTLTHMHMVIPQKDALTQKNGFLIFDAYTGNILLWGV